MPFFKLFSQFSGSISGPIFVYFSAVFAPRAHLAEAGFFEDVPSKIQGFKGRRAQEALTEWVQKGFQKWTPQKTGKSQILEFPGVTLEAHISTLGPALAPLGPVLDHLGPVRRPV